MSHLPLSLARPDAPRKPASDGAAWYQRFSQELGAYWAVTDPKSASLLVFTAVTAAVVAGGLHTPARLVQVTLALALCSMGARATANYIDRDIDALMDRTRRRPLPSGQLSASAALTLGLVLMAAGLVVAWPLGVGVVFLIVLGLADNLVVYALLTKRTSPWSIVLGAPSGGAPAFVGYVAIAGHINVTALLLLAFVLLWTPIHIWSLAIRCQDDYAHASVPMLPVAVGARRCARCIGLASVALAACTVLFVLVGGVQLIAWIEAIVVALALALLLGSAALVHAPTATHAWRLFRFTAPYLALLFALLALNAAMMR